MTEMPYLPPPEVTGLFRRARKILLATHENPDADGVGSLLAAGLALPRLGRQVARVGERSFPPPLDRLPGARRIPLDDGETTYDLALLFDCRTATRLGAAAPALERCREVLVIDHHPVPDGEAAPGREWIVDSAPSTTLLVLSLLQQIGGIEVVDADVATNLYAGLAVDTGGFRHSTTTAAALRAGALLIDRGAEATKVTEWLLHERRPEAIALLSKVLGEATYIEDGQIVLLRVTASMLEESGARVEEAEGFISIASAIEGVNLAAMLLQTGEREWRVSLRAHAPWEVAPVARESGGGGHVLASGFQTEGDLGEIEPKILDRLREELRAGANRR